MTKTVYLIPAIFFCWCGVVQGVQDGKASATTGEVVVQEMVVENGSTDQPPVNNAPDEVVEPLPILNPDEEGIVVNSGPQRNPFREEVVIEDIPDKEYLTIAEQCILRGIIKVNDQQMVLLQLPADEEKKGNSGSGGKLRRYARGDRIMIVDGPQEFHFTLMALDNRSVVLQGANDEEYTLWL